MLGGRYLLQGRIGDGGMGDVWRAEDPILGRSVAIKLLLPMLADDAAFVARFRKEARILAALDHPGIVTIYDYGESTDDDGRDTIYLVMQLIDGHALSRRVQLPIAEALAIIAQVLDALHAAHERGIVHRDIKPSNLIIRANKQITVTDFGIARDLAGTRITATNAILGSAAYISPEQANGEPATPKADVYATGVVAYQLLTGELPFQADSAAETAVKHITQPAPPLPDSFPAPVRELIAIALNKRPDDRYPTAAAMADAVREALRLSITTSELSAIKSESSGSGAAPTDTKPHQPTLADSHRPTLAEPKLTRKADAESPAGEDQPGENPARTDEAAPQHHEQAPDWPQLFTSRIARRVGYLSVLAAGIVVIIIVGMVQTRDQPEDKSPTSVDISWHSKDVGQLAVTTLNNEPTLVSALEDDHVRLIDPVKGTPIGTDLLTNEFSGSPIYLTQLDNRPIMVRGVGTEALSVYDLVSHTPLGGAIFDTPDKPVFTALTLGSLDDRQVIVAGTHLGVIRVWDLITHQQVGDPMTGKAYALRTATVNDQTVLVASLEDGSIQVFDLASHQVFKQFKPFDYPLSDMRITTINGRQVIVGWTDSLVGVWDLATGEQQGALIAVNVWFAQFFEYQGQALLATGSANSGVLHFWNLETHQPVRKSYETGLIAISGLTSTTIKGKPVIVMASDREDRTVVKELKPILGA